MVVRLGFAFYDRMQYTQLPDTEKPPDVIEIFEMLSNAAHGTFHTAMLHLISNNLGTDEAAIRSTGMMLAILLVFRATGTRVSLEGILRSIEKAINFPTIGAAGTQRPHLHL